MEGYRRIAAIRDPVLSGDGRLFGVTFEFEGSPRVRIEMLATRLGGVIETLLAGADETVGKALADGVQVARETRGGGLQIHAREVYVGDTTEPGIGALLIQLASTSVAVRLPRAKLEELRNALSAYLKDTEKPKPAPH